jgi:hypothetical protein
MPMMPRRNFSSKDPLLDSFLDRITSSTGRDSRDLDGSPRIENTGSKATRPGRLYGRDSSRAVVLATVTAPEGPKWLALESVVPGQRFRYLTHGSTLVMMADPSEAVAVGDVAYLSPNVAGAVTPTRPDAGVAIWRCGVFANTRADRDGLIQVDLAMDSEPLEEVIV